MQRGHNMAMMPTAGGEEAQLSLVLAHSSLIALPGAIAGVHGRSFRGRAPGDPLRTEYRMGLR